MTGPYETEQQVRELPAVRAIYDAMYAGRRHGVMGELGYRLLDEACEAASVKVGAYDYRILTWLAGLEPETCAVIAGLITRAHQAETPVTGEHPVMLTAAQAAAVRLAFADAEVYRRQRTAAWCAGCESSPAGELRGSHGRPRRRRRLQGPRLRARPRLDGTTRGRPDA
jgi:hypothetical protein